MSLGNRQAEEKAGESTLAPLLTDLDRALRAAMAQLRPRLTGHEVGRIVAVGNGVALVDGLPGVQAEELLEFQGHSLGMAFNLDRDEVGVILLDRAQTLSAGMSVRRTGRVLDVPVGRALLGRVVDAAGRPLDGGAPLQTRQRWPVERGAPPIMDRLPVTVPLQTGLKVVDALIPIGRGQRELILGDRQTGKTALAVDTIINQRGQGVICVYCAVGQRAASVASVIADLRRHDALSYSVVVVAGGENPPGQQYITPYAATTMAEYFMERGQDVLIIYDDLTHHARAYRELSLLLRRPPGREAYPGDIFYIHSRLLERATRLRPERGGGSLTALPILETEAQNMAAYIPTNLISITDGQIYLSPDLFRRGLLPAVDVGKSVSRVGGQTQLAAYREVAGSLRLSYTQFEELEIFSRFGTQLDAETQQQLERGRRVRELLKQPRHQPLAADAQIAALLAVTAGLFDHLPLERVGPAAQAVIERTQTELATVCAQIQAGDPLHAGARTALLQAAHEAIGALDDKSHADD